MANLPFPRLRDAVFTHLERIPFLWNRDMLQIHSFAHVLVGEPVATSPGHALTMAEGLGPLLSNVSNRLVQASTPKQMRRV
jgi:hypothetical protein